MSEKEGDPWLNYCWDCTPETQAEKLAEDNCEHPRTSFYLLDPNTEDEQLIGLRPNQGQHLQRLKRLQPLDGHD
ncbi:MAG: hypothetical protein KGL39_47550 [Patescibacteria group bacterium]|nr:hypothetical protein [Patescibacteria group bacterium]